MPFNLSVASQLSRALVPDLIVMGGAMLLLLWAVWRPDSLKHGRSVALWAVLICIAAAAAIAYYMAKGLTAGAGIIAVDNFRWASDLLFLVATVIAIALAVDYSEREGLVVAEAYVLLLLATSGMMVLAAARDLIVVFLGIEIMSVSTYVLAGLNRRSGRAAEAALKYFLLGAFSTAFLLYGIALVYGATGSTNLTQISARVAEMGTTVSPMLLIGIGLLLVGFGFKVAAVPFHMWAPDVYEGAPTPFTAYMAAAVKAAAFAALLRVWLEAFSGPATIAAWRGPVVGIAILTMFAGNIIALVQKNMKRLLAYSSIAHAGYLLVAVAAANAAGASAFLFYLLAYTLATMGAFAVVVALGEAGERNTDVADYAGLWTVKPGLALSMAVFMLALLGFPIAGGMGFFAKWYVLQAALQADQPLTLLAALLVMASVISAGYYLYVIVVMFMRPRAADAVPVRPTPRLTQWVVGASVGLLLYFGIFPNWVIEGSRKSVPVASAPASAAPRLTAAP